MPVGADGPLVGRIGLGCMGMSGEFYGPADDAQSVRVIHAALDAGATLLDTADMYGSGSNEDLVGKALRGRRDQAVLATKFGIRRADGRRWNDSSPAYARAACEASLRRLGVDTIDLYYVHRMDATTPVEDTVGELARLVDEGKIRHIGLSEVSAAQVRRAHAVHPIAAVQSEFSLWTRNVVEDGVLAACRELGTALVAYSPLGRGFLTGTVESLAHLAEGDFRRGNPRFAEGGLEANLPLLSTVRDIAAAHGARPAQIALAWVLAQGDDIFPIPGTRRLTYLEENIGAAQLELSPDERSRLDRAFREEAVVGDRYPAAIMPVTR
ncbi:aldo/keto reductase [Streptomyces sp. MZ04]|uniref:aldo/keto reductase n=1 Tax=Streptomyces sp. MZ04 TaxID=2559236 RepID=UPI00107E6A62|nr:aldo/keto reductase [Streptomyces sp. MZ04]TGB08509.1 aldo/keto reductase [Streptomyces sp. MZ04]